MRKNANTSHHGTRSLRQVEPHALVSWGHHWYLVAWDIDRDDWRSFRVDRLRPRTPTGPRFARRELPGGDPAGYLARTLSTGPRALRATVTMHAPATVLAERVWPGMGSVEAVDEHHCRLHLGADTAADLAWMIAVLGVDFTVSGPPQLVTALRDLGERCHRGVAEG